MNIYRNSNKTTTQQKQQQQQMVGAFDSLNRILQWVFPIYIFSYFSLITLWYIVVSFLCVYVRYEIIPNKKQHHNI